MMISGEVTVVLSAIVDSFCSGGSCAGMNNSLIFYGLTACAVQCSAVAG